MNQKGNVVISFIIPLYGKPNSVIKKLIDKIKSLKFSDVEFIIVYKNSEDFNYDWIHYYGNNNLMIIGPVKDDAQRTFKIVTGAKYVSGKWIQIMDAHHDFYEDILEKRVKQLNNKDNYDLIVSSQKVIRKSISGKEKVIWKTRPRFTSGIWNGTTLWKTSLFERYLNEFSKFNISIADDRTYPIVLFSFEQKLKIFYFAKEGYYKQMIYPKQEVNTTMGSRYNVKLYDSFYQLVHYMSEHTERKSYMHYFGFYYLIANSFAFYNVMWKGKRAIIPTRKIILSTKLPKRIKWPLLFIPWYLLSTIHAPKRYKIRRKLKKEMKHDFEKSIEEKIKL